MSKKKEDRLDRVHKKNYLKKLAYSDEEVDFTGSDYNAVGTKRQTNNTQANEFKCPDERSETPSPRVFNAEPKKGLDPSVRKA